jgi:hypothetical protein
VGGGGRIFYLALTAERCGMAGYRRGLARKRKNHEQNLEADKVLYSVLICYIFF